VHSDEHQRLCIYAFNVLTLVTASDPHAVVLHDTRVAWDHPSIEPHGPDIAVIFNVAVRREWSTFDCAVEGTKPTIIFEVTSPKTRTVDVEDKVDEYEEVGLPFYVIVHGDELAFYNERGEYIDGALATWVNRAEAAEERAEMAEKQAQTEAQARTAAEARLRELEAELRRLRGQPDQ
jgi:Uma2 family endonuclease